MLRRCFSCPKPKKRSDGRYARQIYLGIDPATQKRRYKTIYAPTAKEADQLAAEYRAALGRGLDPAAGRTVKALLDNLIAVKRAQGVGASWLRTLDIYARHLSPLWPMPADKVRAADIQQILSDLADAGLSHKNVIGDLLCRKGNLCVGHPETVQYNPCDKVVVPAGRPAKTRGWLDNERQAWVRETPHRAQRAAMVMMYAGLRRGELTALTWADVDLTAKTISVTKSWDFAAGRVKPPKTAAGIRVVHIPQLLVDFLRTERTADPATFYVVHTASGGRMTDSAWKRLWQSYGRLECTVRLPRSREQICGAAKSDGGHERGSLPIVIRTFTPHELRHTFCTLLYLAEVDVLTARDQMGHSDISVTMGIYTHLDKQYKAAKMGALDTYLNKQAVES